MDGLVGELFIPPCGLAGAEERERGIWDACVHQSAHGELSVVQDEPALERVVRVLLTVASKMEDRGGRRWNGIAERWNLEGTSGNTNGEHIWAEKRACEYQAKAPVLHGRKSRLTIHEGRYVVAGWQCPIARAV